MSLRHIPPFARVSKYRMPERGKYRAGGPTGLVVHFTAGEDGAENVIRGGVKNKYTYHCIQRDGQLFCAHNADQWGYHAGESKWKLSGVLRSGVSRDFIGIEINASGGVKPHGNGTFITYYKKVLPAAVVRVVKAEDNRAAGAYHVYTWEQEVTLVNTILHYAREFASTFKIENVVGHDEISGKKMLGYFRKTDPGGALSVTMSQLRAICADLHKHKVTSVPPEFRLAKYVFQKDRPLP